MGEPGDLRVFHGGKVPQGMGIGEGAILGTLLLGVVTTLDIMESAGVPAIVAREEVAVRIDLQPEGVAPTLGNDLEGPGLGVVPPESRALDVGRL